MRKNHTAFTLVELLMVILIIGLLVSILMPSLSKARQLAEATRTRAVIEDISNGIHQYKIDTNYYPGQKDPTVLTTGTYKNKGGSYLARALLCRKDLNNYPTSAYCDYTLDTLLNYGNVSQEPKDNPSAYVFSDRSRDPKPVLYYPSHIGQEGSTDQFWYSDNSIYANAAIDTKPGGYTTLQRFEGVQDKIWPFSAIQDSSNPPYHTPANTKPVHDGEFLLIGAGPDGAYFTGDDVRNW